jgi:hypothetical protein
MYNSLPTPTVADWAMDFTEAFQTHTATLREEGVASVAPQRRPGLVEQFAARIRSSPCATNLTDDYTDARYSLDRAVATSGTSSLLQVKADTLPGLDQCITATNLAELAAGTHLLSPGTVVQVFALYTRPGVKLYVFNTPPPDGAVVQITGPAAGGGKYTGRILTGSSNAVAGGTLNMPEGLTIPDADNALICNVEEDGETGHRLQTPGWAVGQIAGSSGGLAVVMIRGALGSTQSPMTLGDGSAGGLDADNSSWNKASDGTPLDLWMESRTFWDTDSGTLFGYARKLSFDARGVLYAVSGETQYTIDVAQPCE